MRAYRSSCRMLGVLAALAGAAAGRSAYGFVDPNFTPLDVHRQYALICAVQAEPVAADAQAVQLAVAELVKGRTDAGKLTLDLRQALASEDGRAEVKGLLRVLGESASRPAALFVPGPDAQLPNVLLHAEGTWFQASPDDDPRVFHFRRMDTALNGTFNGGSDMLIETMRFIGRFPGAPIMPVDAGVRWDSHERIGRLPGRAALLKAVDVNGDGRLDVFAAGPGGDRVFLARGGRFEPLEGLASASRAADWADFDGDGRADLASLSGAGLTLYLQTEPGTFKTVKAELPQGFALGGSPAVHAADLDGNGRADLIVGGSRLPLVLRNVGGAKFEPLRLEAAVDNVDRFGGEVGPVVVADFDGDGRLDIVQCRQGDGLLFGGRAGGTFAPGVACGAAMGRVERRGAHLADFAGDSRPELLLVGGGQRPVMYVFRGGRFESVTRHMGEPSYIIQPASSAAAVGDFNNDTFVDLFVGYADGPPQSFFNRGFRSLAICEPLKLPAEDVDGADRGQSAVLWADMDGDGSLDLLTAVSPSRPGSGQDAEAGDTVYLSMTTLGAMQAPIGIAVRLGPEAGFAGPLDVTFHSEGYRLGARTIEGRFGRPALMGLPAAGEYTITWRVPGRAEASKTVLVIDSLATVTIGR